MVETYSHENHLELIESWLTSRDMPVPNPSLFGEYGFVVDKVAIGFLRCGAVSKQGAIDLVVTDPDAEPMFRDKALIILFQEIENFAKGLSLEMLTGLVRLSSMKDRAHRLGYSQFEEGYTLVYKVIGGEKCPG